MSKKPQRAFAWAWMLEDGSLCFWAQPKKADLLEFAPPSPKAKPVRVELVRVRRKKRRAPRAAPNGEGER